MFTADSRELLRAQLIRAAEDDPNVVAAATTGSAAVDDLDEWSDIDLALCVLDEPAAVHEWTARVYGTLGAVHHVDVYGGDTRFRVFLLASTLQVDIAFWSRETFGATGPAFRLLFGTADAEPTAEAPEPAELVGLGWLYGLHVRSSLGRGRPWQAEYMLSQLRHTVAALVCVQHGLSAREARGSDSLPSAVLSTLEAMMPRSLEGAELQRAFGASLTALRAAAGALDHDLEARIGPTISDLLQIDVD